MIDYNLFYFILFYFILWMIGLLLQHHLFRRLFLPSLHCFSKFAKIQLGIFVWIHLFVLYSVQLIYVSISLSIPQP